MRILCLTAAAVCLVALSGCANFAPDDTSGLWQDAGVSVSSLHVGSEDTAQTMSSKSVLGAGDRVYFRSSDIEFWSIQSSDELDTISSAKYNTGATYSDGLALEYRIGDLSESIVFMPYENVDVNLSRADLNPDWSVEVAEFVAAGNNYLNLIRLDIGGGSVSFIFDGNQVDMRRADGSDGNGIDANSILFIDKALIKKPVYISRDTESKIIQNQVIPSDLKLTEAEYEVVRSIHTSSNWNDPDTPLDVNGALYIPMTPADISSFDPSENHLAIHISWPIANAVHFRNGEYFMDNRVSSTAFDFSVELALVDGPPPEAGDGDGDGDGDGGSTGGTDLLSHIYSISPGAADTGVYLDQDIHIASWPPYLFELATAQSGFSIQPSVPIAIYTRWFLDDADSELTIELGDLLPDTSYTVTLDTSFTLGGEALQSDYSWSFTTGTEREYAPAVIPGRPEFTSVDHAPSSLEFELAWTGIADATGYEVQETRGEAFTYVDRTLSTTGTAMTIIVSNPNQYYYRVRATNAAGHSEWSKIFFVEPLS